MSVWKKYINFIKDKSPCLFRRYNGPSWLHLFIYWDKSVHFAAGGSVDVASMLHGIVSLVRQLCYIWWRMMMTCSKKLVSSSLCRSDVVSNVFLPWWNSNVYQEPLDRWEIFKELSTNSMSMKCILLHRSIMY